MAGAESHHNGQGDGGEDKNQTLTQSEIQRSPACLPQPGAPAWGLGKKLAALVLWDQLHSPPLSTPSWLVSCFSPGGSPAGPAPRMTNGGVEWRSQGGDGGAGGTTMWWERCPYSAPPQDGPAPSLAPGRRDRQQTACQGWSGLSATSQRHKGKQSRQLRPREPRAPTLFTHHEVGEALEEEERGGEEGDGGGEGEKKEDKVRIPDGSPSPLSARAGVAGPSTHAQEHATSPET